MLQLSNIVFRSHLRLIDDRIFLALHVTILTPVSNIVSYPRIVLMFVSAMIDSKHAIMKRMSHKGINFHNECKLYRCLEILQPTG